MAYRRYRSHRHYHRRSTGERVNKGIRCTVRRLRQGYRAAKMGYRVAKLPLQVGREIYRAVRQR